MSNKSSHLLKPTRPRSTVPFLGIPSVSKWRAFRKKHGKWPTTVEPEALSREDRIDWKVQNGLTQEEAEQEEETEEEIDRKNGAKKESIRVDRDTREDFDIGSYA